MREQKTTPMLMAVPNVHAIEDGLKTHTRREMKPQPPETVEMYTGSSGRHYWHNAEPAHNTDPEHELVCPYGIVGDLLALKETFWAWGYWVDDHLGLPGKPKWRWVDCTDNAHPVLFEAEVQRGRVLHDFGQAVSRDRLGYHRRPSIYLPKVAWRHFLELTEVRIERLHDISEADAWAEGIGRPGRPLEALVNTCRNYPKLKFGSLLADAPELFELGTDRALQHDYERVTATTGRGVYAALWEAINGPGSWLRNPWVWVLGFKRVDGRVA